MTGNIYIYTVSFSNCVRLSPNKEIDPQISVQYVLEFSSMYVGLHVIVKTFCYFFCNIFPRDVFLSFVRIRSILGKKRNKNSLYFHLSTESLILTFPSRVYFVMNTKMRQLLIIRCFTMISSRKLTDNWPIIQLPSSLRDCKGKCRE